MYFEDQEQLPVLIPIRKKRNEISANEPATPIAQKKSNIRQNMQVFPNKQTPAQAKKENQVEKQVRSAMPPEKIEEFDKKFKEIHDMNESAKKKEAEKKKGVSSKNVQIEKSKYLIGEMMRKIDARNITEELYPVTNETIGGLIRRMDEEIGLLKEEAERKENSLSSNPNNQHLKKEIEALKSSIDRCVTIKELYNEKINLRNKISSLEKSIITLKEENTNLKIKINRGIETISNHMHNLPCEKEKELKEQLNITNHELKKEKEMRVLLESNISDIVFNFKRLYDEADTARLIVTDKLKELQEKQKKLAEYQQKPDPEKDRSFSEKRSPQMEAFEEKKLKKMQQGTNPEHNELHPTSKKMPQYSPYSPTPMSIQHNKSKNRAKQTERVSVSPFSMQDQIRKMRNNQAMLAKGYYK